MPWKIVSVPMNYLKYVASTWRKRMENTVCQQERTWYNAQATRERCVCIGRRDFGESQVGTLLGRGKCRLPREHLQQVNHLSWTVATWPCCGNTAREGWQEWTLKQTWKSRLPYPPSSHPSRYFHTAKASILAGTSRSAPDTTFSVESVVSLRDS